MIHTLTAAAITVLRAPLRNSSVLLCIVTLTCCSLNPEEAVILSKNAGEAVLNKAQGIHYFNNIPFTGTLITFGKTTKDTLRIQKYHKGKRHGIWFRYHPNGKLMEKRTYSFGSKEGDLFRYWPDGSLRMHFVLKKDVYHGNNKTWNAKGLLVSDRNFFQGHEKGPQKVWYDDGTLKSNYIIKNNRRYGLLGTKNCITVTDSIF